MLDFLPPQAMLILAFWAGIFGGLGCVYAWKRLTTWLALKAWWKHPVIQEMTPREEAEYWKRRMLMQPYHESKRPRR